MNVLDAALAYVSRGLAVLPVQHRGKLPITAQGVHDASRDPQMIRRWFDTTPSPNVAIAVASSWRVLDVDPRNGGDVELGRLLEQHGELPVTISARTGGGGAHFLLAFPPGQYRGKVGPGLDLLGPGRYFLAAPSVHPSGGVYAWTCPKGTAIAPAPTWLLELARVKEVPHVPPPATNLPPDRVDRARKYLAKCAHAVSGQGGHSTTFLVAQKLVRGFQLDEGTAFALLCEWNKNCAPPWSPNALRRKVREAMRAGQMRPGALLEQRRSGTR